MRGGKQPGAGRPKGTKMKHTLDALEMRKYLVKRVSKELEPILTSQIELAKGLWYEKIGIDGTIKIFKEKPDINASKYLFDQAIGRAKESVELSGGIKLLILDE